MLRSFLLPVVAKPNQKLNNNKSQHHNQNLNNKLKFYESQIPAKSSFTKEENILLYSLSDQINFSSKKISKNPKLTNFYALKIKNILKRLLLQKSFKNKKLMERLVRKELKKCPSIKEDFLTTFINDINNNTKLNEKKIEKIKKVKSKKKQKKFKPLLFLYKFLKEDLYKKKKKSINLKKFYKLLLVYKKIKFFKILNKIIILDYVITKDCKLLLKKSLNLKNIKITNVFFIRQLNQQQVSAYFVSEYLKFKIMQQFNVNWLYRKLRKYFRRSRILRGYRIEINGRPFKTSRSRRFILQRGILKNNTLSSYVDYSLSTVRTKFGICGIKVWINKKTK